jgi:hypothetical protein
MTIRISRRSKGNEASPLLPNKLNLGELLLLVQMAFGILALKLGNHWNCTAQMDGETQPSPCPKAPF